MEQIKSFLDKLQNEITDVQDLEALKQIKAKYLSKSVFLIELKSKIREASQEEKQEIGNQINLYSKGVQEILNDRKDHIENNFTFDEVENPFLNDETMELPKSAGSLHPFTILSNEIQQFFNKNGYVYSHGIEVEEEKYNFDILNMPADHPARAMQDTFYLDNGKLLRTHCTNTTARALEQTTSDTFKHYTIGTVFRNDDNDATHSFQFNQIDIFSLSKNTSIANLKWTLDSLLKHIFSEELETRYRISYFPFTEPSFEVDVRTNKDSNWIEILGSGMLNPNVIKNVGKDPESFIGFAAGIGLERLAMNKWLVKDIRDFYTNDIKFLKQQWKS